MKSLNFFLTICISSLCYCSIEQNIVLLDYSLAKIKNLLPEDSFEKIDEFVKSKAGKAVYSKMSAKIQKNLKDLLKNEDFSSKIKTKKLTKKQMKEIEKIGENKEKLKNLLTLVGKSTLKIPKKVVTKKKTGVSPQKVKDLNKKFEEIGKGLEGIPGVALSKIITQLREITLGKKLGDKDITRDLIKKTKFIFSKLKKIKNFPNKDHLVSICKYILAANPQLALQVVDFLKAHKVSNQSIYALIIDIYDLLITRLEVFKDMLPEGSDTACLDLSLVLSYPVVLSALRNSLKERSDLLDDDAKGFLTKFEERENNLFQVAKTANCDGIDIKSVQNIAKWDDERSWCKKKLARASIVDEERIDKGRYLPEGSSDGIFGEEKKHEGRIEGKLTYKKYYRCFDYELKDVVASIDNYNEISKSDDILGFLHLLEKQKVINAVNSFCNYLSHPKVCPVCLYNDLAQVDPSLFDKMEKFLGEDKDTQSVRKKIKILKEKRDIAKKYGPYCSYFGSLGKYSSWRDKVENYLQDEKVVNGDYVKEALKNKAVLERFEQEGYRPVLLHACSNYSDGSVVIF